MYMKTHILTALREEFDHWERVLAGLSEATIDGVSKPDALSIKDEIAHLMAWQQRSIARMEAALHNQEPKMPDWLPSVSLQSEPQGEEDTDQLNARIYETFRNNSWSETYQQWHSGFLRFLELSEAIPEPALLDSSRFAWLGGYSLADILLGSYDHHQEHLEKLLAKLGQSQP